jgi:ribonuclease P protein component
VGGAVARNRWKRLLREAFRLKQANIPSGLDLIVIPRQTAKPELGRLMKSLPALARRLAKRLAGAKSANSASEPSK